MMLLPITGSPHLGWTQYMPVSPWEWITVMPFLKRVQKEEEEEEDKVAGGPVT